jgi:hypothetical protein
MPHSVDIQATPNFGEVVEQIRNGDTSSHVYELGCAYIEDQGRTYIDRIININNVDDVKWKFVMQILRTFVEIATETNDDEFIALAKIECNKLFVYALSMCITDTKIFDDIIQLAT